MVDRNEPRLGDLGVTARPRGRQSKSKNRTAAGGGWMAWLLVFTLLGLVATVAYLAFDRQQQAEKLTRIQQLMSQQTALAERLDQLGISEQQYASSQDFNELAEQQSFQMSEIRKLWALSNERNRPQIEALSTEQQQLFDQLAELQAQVVALDGSDADAKLAALQAELASLKQAQATQKTEQTQSVQALSERLQSAQADFNTKLTQLSSAQSQPSPAANGAELVQLREALDQYEQRLLDLRFLLDIQQSELMQIKNAAGNDISLAEWIQLMDANRFEMVQRINALQQR